MTDTPAPASTLHFTNFYHEESGGIRTMYHELLDYAERNGRRMTLVVPGADDRIEPRGRSTRIVHVRAPRSPIADGRYRILLPHRFIRQGTGRLWEILDEERPDVVEVCDKYSLPFFAGLIRRRRRAGRPSLVGLSCERLDDNIHAFVGLGAAGRAFARAVVGRVYVGMFDVHLANSEYTAAELRSAMRRPHLRPVHVCTPGVTLPEAISDADRTAARRELLARCGRVEAAVLIYAGRLSNEKNATILPHVVAALDRRLPEVHLVLAGDGPLRGELESVAATRAAGRVHVVGHVPRHALWRLLHGADAFVHPNPREPFGLGPLEAMAAGTPVVAPASGGLASYLTGDNAWPCGPDPASMAGAVAACLDNPEERRRRAAIGRATAARHSWTAAAGRMFARYDAAPADAATHVAPASPATGHDYTAHSATASRRL